MGIPKEAKICVNDVANTHRIHIDGVPCQLDANQTFQYNGVAYVMFQNTLTLRQHTSFSEFTTQKFKTPFIIGVAVAEEIIKDIINISSYNLNVINSLTNESMITRSLPDTFIKIKNSLVSLSTTSDVPMEDAHGQTLSKTLQLLTNICDSISSEDILNGIFASQASQLTVKLNPTLPVGDVLSQFIEYIVNYVCFDDAIIQMRGLNSSLDLFYSVIYVIMLYESFIPTDLFTTTTDLIMQTLIQIIYDGVTDRTSAELFIRERNETATALKRKYFAQYKFLLASEINNVELKNSDIMSKVQQESITLMPYLLTFSMSDHQRVCFLYNHFYENRKELPIALSAKWLGYEQLFNYLALIWKPTVRCPSRYDTDAFLTIIPELLSLFQVEEAQEIKDIESF